MGPSLARLISDRDTQPLEQKEDTSQPFGESVSVLLSRLGYGFSLIWDGGPSTRVLGFVGVPLKGRVVALGK